MTSDRLGWLLLGVAVVVLVVHALAYNFVTDDAYISFVYARNLAEHGQLTFNLGDPVEGYTNFLWTMLLGAGMLAQIPPEISSRVLGAAAAAGTLFVVFRTMERALGRKTPWAAVPALMLACSSGFACWTSGGLETQLFTLLCTVALDGVVAAESPEPGRGLRRAALALALAAMTRPEGLIVAFVLFVVRLICNVAARRRIAGRPEAFAAAIFIGLWAPWFAWRWWYYGWPFPNTYYVKASGKWQTATLARDMWRNGLYYLWVWLKQTKLLYALPVALIGLSAARPRTPRFALGLGCALLASAYLTYTVSVGGDFMGLHRFIMPIFVVAAIAVVLGLEWLAERLPQAARAPTTIAVVLVVLGAFATTQALLTVKSLEAKNLGQDHGIDTPAFLTVYTEDRATIGKAMQNCFLPTDFSIVGGAGAQPYYGRMRAIDVFGLVSDRIAHGQPRVRARAGHTKFAPEDVQAAYDPTFVFACYALHPTPAAPPIQHWQAPCNASYWLGRGYELVTVHIPGLQQFGEYYTFFAKKARQFQCPLRVH